MSARIRNLLLVLGFCMVLAAAGAGGYYYWHQTRLPAPGTPRYVEYVRAFQVGVAALESPKSTQLALERLNEAKRIVPGEPAAWANLALLHLRENRFREAAAELKRAQELAPSDRPEINELLGLLARQQGQFPEAAAHFRKAVEQTPRDLVLIFTLADLLEQVGGADSNKEVQQLMERVLDWDPNNLRALVLRASAAYQRDDKAALRDTIVRLDRLAPGWGQQSRAQIATLHQALAKGSRDVPVEIARLHNCVKGERGYRRGTGNIREDAQIGSVIHHFLRLQQAPPVPAPADRALTFAVGAWSHAKVPELAKTRWDTLSLQWRIREARHSAVVDNAITGGPAAAGDAEFEAAVWLSDGQRLRRADMDGATHEFPGGPKQTPPSVAGVLALDWDNDLRLDLLLAGAGGLRFLHAEADGSFTDVTAKTGLPAAVLNDDYYGAWAADIEMDGDLDIVLARRDGAPLVLRNNGDGTFKPLEIPEFAAVRGVRSFVWADLDNDGACDAIFLDEKGKLHLFANERFTRFSAWAPPKDLGPMRALTVADVNDDGVFDLVALRQDGMLIRISDVDHRQSWQQAELARAATPDGAIGTSVLFAEDLDNNGAIDLIVAGPRSAQVFLADEQFHFEALPNPIPLHVFAVLDLNNDGRLDLLGLSAEGQPLQALSTGTKDYHWQLIRPFANPKGTGDNRNNSFAIGGEIEIRSGLHVEKQRITGPMVHFGLGAQTGIDVIRVIWPSGEPQYEFEPLAAATRIMLGQRLTGSCPFLFTHDGTGMRFAGDCLWNTPLGMFVNGQNVDSFGEITEWLRIPGDYVAPRNGVYDLRVHANLWETDYFDEIALLVVDHPPNTEIHVDERFFLTPTKPKLYVTAPARPVARAWDHHGKDATDLVAAIDGRYLDRAGRGKYQGITTDHWVEADLGDDAPTEGPLYLIARGWTHPTDSSINAAIAQGRHEMPRPVVLEVPDGKGGWKVGRPALGFPAGKNKSMLIRLDGIDGPGVTRRFRLRTNMEIYWDFLGYGRGLDENLARIERPTPKSAELRYRGFLEMTQKDASSPELPVYDRVMRGRQLWRDLEGYYTRYGDVRELLAKVDDRYVIMNAGDEIALEYPVPAVPDPGWRRDFIFECDGWTRDGNPNTRFGTTVLPLPMHGIKSLDQPPGRLEDDPVVRRFPEDWRQYHTRYVSTADFERGLRPIRRR
jgi:cytochrome c-type biogenesis protein CcmH/NrfG